MITKLLSQKYVYVGVTGAAAAILFLVSLSPEPVMSSHTPDDVVCSGCVGSGDIGSAAVTNAKIATGAVTNGKIASNAVTTTKIFDGTITSSDIATNAVGALDIADGAVSDSELADSLPYTGRLAFVPFVKTVPDGGFDVEPFGLSGAEVGHNFVQIDCNDFDGCQIPNTSSVDDISPGFPGQILIISTVDSGNVVIFEQLSPGAGVSEVNLAATSRTLTERGDTLVLLYHDGEWNELSFTAVGPP